MAHINIHLSKFASIVLIVIGSLGASGQVLRGNVVNGTTKKPASGDDVILVKIDQGMTEEKRTKSNARGEFSFDLPDSQSMRAIRVLHQKISYYQPVVPGSATVTVTVYESEPTVQGIHQTSQSVVFQAQGNTIQVFEIFDVRNDSQPPRTQPGFSFNLPEGATVESGQAMRQGAMPLKVAPAPVGDNRYSISYPLLPGETHFEVPYKLPYSGTLKFQPRMAGPVEKYVVVTPKSMGFTPGSGSQYQASDPQSFAPDLKGMDVHVAANTGDEKQLAFSITGEGLIPQDTGQQSAGEQAAAAGRPGEEDRPGGGMGIPNERPNPLSQGQWAFLGVLSLFMAGGAAFVFMGARQPTVVAAGPSPNTHSASLLDALKEEMFQLEADRIQGKLTQQEYQGAKAVLDKTLQRAMKKK